MRKNQRATIKTTFIFIALLIAAVTGSVTAQITANGSNRPGKKENSNMNSNKMEQEIINLSRQKWQWMAERNVDTLDALFSDKAVFVHMGGAMSRKEELDVIRSGAIQYKNAEIQEVSVQIIDKTAVLLNKIRLTAIVGGSDDAVGTEVVNPFVVTEVYVQQSGGWKLASLSFTKLMTQ